MERPTWGLIMLPIVATYHASRDAYERLNRDYPEYAVTLVHTNLPYPIYRTAEDLDVPELPEEIEAFA